jgi:hypothetical protein
VRRYFKLNNNTTISRPTTMPRLVPWSTPCDLKLNRWSVAKYLDGWTVLVRFPSVNERTVWVAGRWRCMRVGASFFAKFLRSHIIYDSKWNLLILTNFPVTYLIGKKLFFNLSTHNYCWYHELRYLSIYQYII